MQPSHRPPCERRYREEHAKLVVGWLRHHYELADSRFTILKATVFHDYLVMCRQTGVESTTAAVFGRFVKRAFPSIRCSRKGLDGRSLHCYRCLKRRADSTESSPRVLAPTGEELDLGAPASCATPTEESSQSDSADEGYDEELRNTIEELSMGAGGSSLLEFALSAPPQHTEDKIDGRPTGNGYFYHSPVRQEVEDPTAFTSRSLSMASIPNFPVLDRAPAQAQSFSIADQGNYESSSTAQSYRNSPTYYPSQGREYLAPYPPQPYTRPRYPTMRTYPATFPNDYNPSDSNYFTTSSSQHTSTTTSYSALRSSPAMPTYVLSSSSSSNFRDQWPYEGEQSLRSIIEEQPTPTTSYSMDPCAGDPSAYPVSALDEPWSTANPTPYSGSVSYRHHQQEPELPSPSQFRPRLKTQACPVHIQPTTFPPYQEFCHPLQMRTT